MTTTNTSTNDTERIQSRQQAREEATIYQTGGWYIAELDDPQLVVQSESEADAREKIAKRWEEYTTESDHSDIRLGSSEDSNDRPHHYSIPCYSSTETEPTKQSNSGQ